jgi:hypothetical protein
VSEHNGAAGIQCTACSGGSYTFDGWRDVLRVLYAGMEHGAGSDLALRDCDSDLRRSLAESYSSLFEGGCSSGTCGAVTRAFRPGDLSSASILLLSALGLPEASASPYCNARRATDTWAAPPAPPSQPPNAPPYYADFQDNDPIRRSCAGTGNLPLTPGGEPPNEPTEQVCSGRGDLGLVLPIAPPPVTATNSPVPYPVTPCSRGKFVFGAAPSKPSAGTPSGTSDYCPNGDAPFFVNRCLLPATIESDTRCLNGRNNLPAFEFNPATAIATDGRVYNLHLRRDAVGNYARDTATHSIVGAFYRIHSTRTLTTPANQNTCTQAESGDQLGCLAQASACSLSLAEKRAGLFSGTRNVALGGIEPTVPNIQRALNAADPLAYPLVSKVYLNSMMGLLGLTDVESNSLWTCWQQAPVMGAATIDAKYVPLGQNPICVDFDERQCSGVDLNKNSCKRGLNLCPPAPTYSVAPQTTNVGSQISLSASVVDPDGDPIQYVWTASSGTIADKFAAQTSYTCTEAGTHVITLRVYDGRCFQTQHTVNVNVTCN